MSSSPWLTAASNMNWPPNSTNVWRNVSVNPRVYGSPTLIVAAFLLPSSWKAKMAAACPARASFCAVRRNPGCQSSPCRPPTEVKEGAVDEPEIITKPASDIIFIAVTASPEQLGPTMPTICGSAATFSAAVVPPSPEHLPSAPTSSTGWPRSWLPRSSTASSTQWIRNSPGGPCPVRFWITPIFTGSSGPTSTQPMASAHSKGAGTEPHPAWKRTTTRIKRRAFCCSMFFPSLENTFFALRRPQSGVSR